MTMNRCGIALTMKALVLLQDGNPIVAGTPRQFQDLAASRNRKRGGDIRQRIQDEVAARHSGARHSQPRPDGSRAQYPEQTHVIPPWSPALLPISAQRLS